MENRITRVEMFMDIAKTVSKRSSCPKKQVGAVLVKDNRIIATGYNGVLPGDKPKEGYNPKTNETKTVHAEANIISFCAKEGISTNGCTMYITLSPCEKCAELIIQSGIKKIIFFEKYRCDNGLSKLFKHKVEYHHYESMFVI